MCYIMVNKYMTQTEDFSILETSRSCGNVHCSYQQYQPGKITLHFAVLRIEYLVATSYKLYAYKKVE